VGTWIGLANPSSVTALDNFMRGVVLQARHASLSSRMPVTIRFDAAAGTVGSHQQILLWQEAYDWPDSPTVSANTDGGGDPEPVFDFGATGFGFRFLPGTDPSYLPPEELQEPLIRRQGDGFYLSCSVRLPPLPPPGSPPGNALQIPLLMLQRGGGSDRVDLDRCIAGLEVWALPQFAYEPTAVNVTGPTDDNTALRGWVWMPVGWVAETGRPVSPMPTKLIPPVEWSEWNAQAYGEDNFVRGWYDTYDVQKLRGTALHGKQQGLHTIRPDHWHDLALLYDGVEMSLFLDGVQVDSLPAPGHPPPNNVAEQVFALRGELIDDQDNDRPKVAVAIDDAQVVRVGSIAPQRIPNGFLPVQTAGNPDSPAAIQALLDNPQDYRLSVRSGAVSLTAGDTTTTSLTFSNGTVAMTFTIGPTGITSTQTYPKAIP
jgi:hypothetical protein